MKKITYGSQNTIILLVLILAGFSLTAQSGWQQVYTGSDNVRDMSFVAGADNSWGTGWILTTSSNLIKTTDGGDTWTLISQSEASAVNGVCFVDENIGYMSSANGEIIKSTDGGTTWATVYENSADWFGQLAFKDSLNGAVSGLPPKYTTDGGATWTSGTYSTNYDRVDYASVDTYFSCGLLAGKVGKSDDNGASWTDVKTTSQLLVTVESLDENHAISGGSNFTVYYTTNGGTSWEERILSGGSGDVLCSGYFDKDTIYVAGSDEIYKSTNGGSSFLLDTTITATPHRAMFVTPTNTVYVASDPMQVWRKIGPSPLVVDFEVDQTLICTGTTINFTDLSFGQNMSSWAWTFEGGTPATSSDQNPTVVYDSPGVFDVSLTVTDDNGSETKTEYDFITVLETPAQADMPDGDDQVCTSGYYDYSIAEIPYADTYEWELLPADAGTLTTNANEATLEVDDDWTGDFTIKARATNMCGDGDWSDNLEGTVYLSPEEFGLQGGGVFCEGGEGVELTLDGSQSDIEYELLLDGEYTGITVDGTGSEVSFGMVTEEGYYSAEGSNSTCSTSMTNQVLVEVTTLPSEPATPTGPEVICEETTSDYTSTGGDDADSYEWVISPAEAGTITSDGLEATVTWNTEFEGIAMISLYGVNECGDGDSSEELEVSVGAPNPEVSGEALVCDWSDEFYETAEHEGSTYTWEVTGGTITDGQDTYIITVAWEGEGDGSISVEEETADGCSGTSETFEVMIDDCTGVDEEANASAINIYPNPARDYLTVKNLAGDNLHGTILIFSHTGQKVFEENIVGNNEHQIHIGNLKSGLYVLKIQLENRTILSKRFIKNQ